jgi:hypothetical protein
MDVAVYQLTCDARRRSSLAIFARSQRRDARSKVERLIGSRYFAFFVLEGWFRWLLLGAAGAIILCMLEVLGVFLINGKGDL